MGFRICFFAALFATACAMCYVSSSGHDSVTCSSSADPCLTISYAISARDCPQITIQSKDLFLNHSVEVPPHFTQFTLTGEVNTMSKLRCDTAVPPFSAITIQSSAMVSLTLARLSFLNCHAPVSGGALRINTSSPNTVDIHIEDCLFDSCSAPCGGGALDLTMAHGPGSGGLNLTLSRSRFEMNTVVGGACPAGADAGPLGGGAVRVRGDATVTPGLADPAQAAVGVDQCIFHYNGVLGRPAEAAGGALLAASVHSVTLNGSLFDTNRLAVRTRARGAGAAVLRSLALRVEGSTFARNGDYPESDVSEWNGGGLAFDDLADDQGHRLVGATVALLGTNFTANLLVGHTVYGGAAFLSLRGPLVVRGTVFSQNQVQSPGNDAGCAFGAGLYAKSPKITIEGSDFLGNSVVAPFMAQGGGLMADFTQLPDSTLWMADCRLVANQLAFSVTTHTIFEGAGLYSHGAMLAVLAGVTATGNLISGLQDSRGAGISLDTVVQEVRVDGLSCAHNRILLTVQNDQTEVMGACLHIRVGPATRVLIDGSQFTDNIIVGIQAFGAALGLSSLTPASSLAVTNSLFLQNAITAPFAGKGAGIYFPVGQAVVANSTFAQNTVSSREAVGGALCFEGASAQLDNVTMLDNSVVGALAASGGALAATGDVLAVTRELAMHGCTLDGNWASCPGCLVRGGAVFVSGLVASLVDTVFTGRPNTQPLAEVYAGGGCLYATQTKPLTVQGCVFTQCQAQEGGALMSLGSDLRLVGCSFGQCRAEDEGGAVFLNAGRATMTGSSCVGCSAIIGGCISGQATALTIDGSQLEANRGELLGGALYLDSSQLTMRGSQAAGNRAPTGTGGVASLYRGNATPGQRRPGHGLVPVRGSFGSWGDTVTGSKQGAFFGAGFFDNLTLAIHGSTFEENLAELGGALAVVGCSCLLEGSLFAHNTASGG
ncbi:hypothetical protein PAPYR_5074 [Paratrimastix pyriformis]|uniref:Uncharacterized protein n=1 Tax=Paratrimastix pyriformis TaxID=342808 RepID=A0ABQ8UJN6_9EUKA|nr:hypothetical protein PAPYR_5074 [Paratrimastix pyriformis]